jgi:hypothetical protein
MAVSKVIEEICESFREWDGEDVSDVKDDLKRLLELDEEEFVGTGFEYGAQFIRGNDLFPNGNFEWPDDLGNTAHFVVMDKNRNYLAIEISGRIIHSDFRDSDNDNETDE